MLNRASRLAVRTICQGRVFAAPTGINRVACRNVETDAKKPKGTPEKKAAPAPPSPKASNKGEVPFAKAFEKVELPLSWNGVVATVLNPIVPLLYETGKDKIVRDELKGLSDLTLRDPFTWDKINDIYKQNQFKNSNFSQITRMLLAELGRRGELKLIPKISETLEDVMKQLNNEHSIRVTLPVEPTPEQVQELKEELFVHLYKNDPTVKIDLTVDVNPAIIAGRVYHFRDGMLNMSAGQYLEQYKDSRLAERLEEETAAAEIDAKHLRPLNDGQPISSKQYNEMLQAE